VNNFPEFRAEHLDTVLRHYHETLLRVVKESGTAALSYSYSELLADYRLCMVKTLSNFLSLSLTEKNKLERLSLPKI
jgi:hypothetical protein